MLSVHDVSDVVPFGLLVHAWLVDVPDHRTEVLGALMNGQQVRQIAEQKMPDLNAHDVDQASKIIEGTARSMGIEVAQS